MVTAQRNCIMSRIKSKNTKGEVMLYEAFNFLGLYPERWGRLFGKPDFVFPHYKVVVFMDGDFWHGCPRHFKLPKTRKKFWSHKFVTNKLRDTLVTSTLTAMGYRVFRFWECQVKKRPLYYADTVRKALFNAS